MKIFFFPNFPAKQPQFWTYRIQDPSLRRRSLNCKYDFVSASIHLDNCLISADVQAEICDTIERQRVQEIRLSWESSICKVGDEPGYVRLMFTTCFIKLQLLPYFSFLFFYAAQGDHGPPGRGGGGIRHTREKRLF